MARRTIFRAHLGARRAPRVGLVHERRDSYYGTTRALTALACRGVHMRQNEPSLWPGVLPRPLPSEQCPSLSQAQSSSPSVSSPSSTVCPSSSPPLTSCCAHFSPAISSGLYVSLFAGCVGVLYNKRRRRGGGNYRLILVSTILFVLITWVRPSLRRSHLFPIHSLHSIWSSTSFVCTSPSMGVRQIKERINTTSA